jgi:hypothetical protein
MKNLITTTLMYLTSPVFFAGIVYHYCLVWWIASADWVRAKYKREDV